MASRFWEGFNSMVMNVVPWNSSRLRVGTDLSCLWFMSLSHLAEGPGPGFPQLSIANPAAQEANTLSETECQAEGRHCPQHKWVGDIQGFPTGLLPGSSRMEKGTVQIKPWGWSILVCLKLRSNCDRKWCQRGTQMTSHVGSWTLVSLFAASCQYSRIPETSVQKEQKLSSS